MPLKFLPVAIFFKFLKEIIKAVTKNSFSEKHKIWT